MRIAVLAALLLAGTAHAQVDRRYAEEPTGGVDIPTTPLAGEMDARAVVANPGGLPLLRGTEVALALDLQDPDVATSSGPGFGMYGGGSVGGRELRVGWGVGLEFLRPSRAQLEPDPGEPVRFTLGLGIAAGPNAGIGLAWHHFHDDSGTLDGVDTFDLGVTGRLGPYFAAGAALRDIATEPIGGTPVQRRYELELVGRPLGTDRLELALGGRLGEIRLDVDGWARISARVARGITVHGAVESRAVHALVDSPVGEQDIDGRDLRVTLGLEVSFGQIGVTALATGLRDDTAKNHALGGTLVVRGSTVGTPAVNGPRDHIERVELTGEIGAHELVAMVMRLRAIARDPSAKGLVVTFDGASAGMATFEEIRDEILRVKRAGKPVFAYLVSGTGRDYYVATAATKIYLDPAGGLRLIGMAATTYYFKGAFDQIGVLAQFEKIAEFKSAPEQLTETGPTPTAARMHDELYGGIWDRWVATIAEARQLTHDEVVAIVDNGPYTAGQLAENTRLVDAVAAPDKVSELIATALGANLEVDTPPIERPERWKRPGVAVIYVEGDITDGTSKSVPVLGQSLAGGETLVNAIIAARNDDRVGAIILRIDSPGGSALASELIAREIFATRGVKPILCSMSDLAASGGYFVAAGCEVIYAEPMTITGSIGIFSGKFDVSGLAKKLGVTTDTWKRGKRADAESLFRPFTDEERTVLMGELRYGYSRFVGAVADGRKLTKQAVDDAGRGHVYTGEQALPLKLVDKLGGFADALDDARARMGLAANTVVQLYELPEPPTNLLTTLTNFLHLRAEQQLELTDLPAIRSLLRGIPASILVSPESMQARLPFDITWQ